ncbi:MAG: endo-1,4-beta-xylanase, partial [Mariniphaga sp.]|nr:endo-1,4-beta-xylanase [Mariniphaga sp.]
MIKKQFYLLFALLISSYFMYGQLTPIPDGRRLREIIADKYKDGNLLIGGTTGQWAFGTATGEILDREFSYVTPENDFKQRQIHPDNTDKWNWSQADSWIGHIATNGQTLRMHGPISPQCSNWVKDDARTAAELEKNMRDFMEALCQRYNGTLGFEYMDVVNETVINGAWHKNKSGFGWEVPWFIIGQNSDENKTPLYIRYAFEIASEYVTDTKLIYNHHERTIINLSWNLVKKTILYLRGLGLRVDGIGWQAHINAGWEQIKGQTDALRDIIDWAHQNNLEFHITENSVFLNGNTPSDYEKQADTYKALFDILIEKSNNGEIGWNTWHIDEGHGSKTENYPAIFDKNYKAKPAYYAIQLALEAEGDYTTPYEVGFQVINTESGFPIKDCSVIINDDTVRTNSAGLAVFQNVTAGIYNARAEKKYY